jgi:phosphoribosyl-AMP cyclohydrolase
MVKLDFSKSADGLIPAIAQDYKTGEVLMLAYINEESWAETLRSGCATYWTRSRQKLWKKGESSGNVQEIKEILVDCDEDTVIFKVNQIGDAACHVGYRSCFFRKVEGDELVVVGKKVFNPEDVYK